MTVPIPAAGIPKNTESSRQNCIVLFENVNGVITVSDLERNRIVSNVNLLFTFFLINLFYKPYNQESNFQK